MAESALLNSMIQRVGEKLPVYSGLSPSSFESDVVVRQNATALIEMSLFKPRETLTGLVGLLEDVSRPALASTDLLDPDNRYLNSQFVVLKLVNDCLALHTRHAQPELCKIFHVNEARRRDRFLARSLELAAGDGGGAAAVPPPPPLDDATLKYLFNIATRLLLTSSHSVNPDALVHAYGDNLALSYSANDVFGDCQKLVGQIVYFVSAVNWPVVFQRIKARLAFLANTPVGENAGGALPPMGLSGGLNVPGPGGPGGARSSGLGGVASLGSGFFTHHGNDEAEFVDASAGNAGTAQAAHAAAAAAAAAMGPAFGDLTEIRLIEYLHLDDRQLVALLGELAYTIRSMKRPAQAQLAISLRPALWNWIRQYPAQFAVLCAERRRLDASAEVLFDFFNGLADNVRRKQIFWPTQTLLLATCQDIVGDYVTNAEIRSARGITALSTLSTSTSSLNRRAQFLTDLRKNLKSSKLTDIALICLTEFAKASTYSLAAENSAMRAWALSIEGELKEKMLETGRLASANLGKASSSGEPDSQCDPRLMMDFFACSWKLNPTSFVRFLVPLIVSESAPVIFQKALAKGCASGVFDTTPAGTAPVLGGPVGASAGASPSSPGTLANMLSPTPMATPSPLQTAPALAVGSSGVSTASGIASAGSRGPMLDARLAGSLRQLFLDNRERVLADAGAFKRNVIIPRPGGALPVSSPAVLLGALNAGGGGAAAAHGAGGPGTGNSGATAGGMGAAGPRNAMGSVGAASGSLLLSAPGGAVDSGKFGASNSTIGGASAGSAGGASGVIGLLISAGLRLGGFASGASAAASYGYGAGGPSGTSSNNALAAGASPLGGALSPEELAERIEVTVHILRLWRQHPLLVLERESGTVGPEALQVLMGHLALCCFEVNAEIRHLAGETVRQLMHPSLVSIWSAGDAGPTSGDSVPAQPIKTVWAVSTFFTTVLVRALVDVDVSAFSSASTNSGVYHSANTHKQFSEFVRTTIEVVRDVLRLRNRYLRFHERFAYLLRGMPERTNMSTLLEALTLVTLCSTEHDACAAVVQCVDALLEECNLTGEISDDAITRSRVTQTGLGRAGMLTGALGQKRETAATLMGAAGDGTRIPPEDGTGAGATGAAGADASRKSSLESVTDAAARSAGTEGNPGLSGRHAPASNASSNSSLSSLAPTLRSHTLPWRASTASASGGTAYEGAAAGAGRGGGVGLALLDNFGMYSSLVSYVQSSGTVVTGQKAQQKKLRRIVRGLERFTLGSLLGWEELYRRWMQNVQWILRPESHREMVLRGLGEDAAAAGFGDANSLGATVRKRNFAATIGKASASQLADRSAHVSIDAFDDRGEWQNYAGLLCVLGGPMYEGIKQQMAYLQPVLAPGAGALPGSTPAVTSGTAGTSHVNTTGGLPGTPGTNPAGAASLPAASTLQVGDADLANLAQSPHPADQMALLQHARARIETFIIDLVELALCDHVLLREAIKDTLGNDLFPSLLNQLLSYMQIVVMNMFEPSGDVVLTARHTAVVDNLISVVKLVLERAHECSDALMDTDLGSLVHGFVRYASRVTESAGGMQTRIRVRLCQLVETLVLQREYVAVRQELKLRNTIVHTFMEWTSLFTMASEEAVAEDMLLSRGSGSSVQRDMTLACLRCIVTMTHKMPLYVADAGSADSIETRSRLFTKIFGFHLKLLRVCQTLENRADTSTSSGRDVLGYVAQLRTCCIMSLSNVISANVDVGLKYSLTMGYADDAMTKAAFMHIFKNLLNADTEFEGLGEGKDLLQDRYEKMVDLLLEPGLELVLALLETAPSASVDELAQLLYNVFSARGQMLRLLKAVAQREVQRTDSPSTLFRRNSAATKLLTLFSKAHGSDFLRATLRVPLQFLVEYSRSASFEVDPARLAANADGAELRSNAAALSLVTQTFIDAIISSAPRMPARLREVCASIAQAVAVKFPGSSALLAVGGFVILRFFNPAITSPDHYNIVASLPTANGKEIRRALVLISKVIQNLANNVLFGAKEAYMTNLNSLVASNRDRVVAFLREISAADASDAVTAGSPGGAKASGTAAAGRRDGTPLPSPVAPEPVRSIEQADYVRLHRYLRGNLDSLESAMQMPPRRFSDATPGVAGVGAGGSGGPGGPSGSASETPGGSRGAGTPSVTFAGPAGGGPVGGPVAAAGGPPTGADGTRRSPTARLAALLQQMGPPAELRADVSSGAGPSARSALTGQLYRDFMERFQGRSLDEFAGKQILYEGAGMSRQRCSVLYFIAARVHRQLFDGEMLMYYILKVMEPLVTKPYELVVDLTGFSADNELGVEWYGQLSKLLLPDASSNLRMVYLLNANHAVRALAKKQSRLVGGKLADPRHVIVASSVAELHEHIAPADLQLPKTTMALDKDVTLYAPVNRQIALHARIPVILKLNQDYLQCTTAKKQDLFGHAVTLNDVVHIAEIEDVSYPSSTHADEFSLRTAGGRVVFNFSSPKADVIVKALRAAKARHHFANRPTAAVERVLHPNDVPGTLLNIAMLNLGSPDATLRISAYELLYSLCVFFGFDTARQVLATNGLCIPNNVTRFVQRLSQYLAVAEPQLALEFLTEFLVGFMRSSRGMQQFALAYVSPWLVHLFPNIRLLHELQRPSSRALGASGASAAGAATPVSTGGSPDEKTSGPAGQPAATGSTAGAGNATAGSQVPSQLPGAAGTDFDARALAKTAQIVPGLVDVTVRTFADLDVQLQEHLWGVLAQGGMQTLPYMVDLFVAKAAELGIEHPQTDALLYMMVGLAQTNRQLVAGRVVTRLRMAIAGTASVPTHSLVQHPAWREIGMLVRFTLALTFNDLVNVGEYLPDLVYIVSELAGVGSPLIRHSVHGIVVNVMQTFCTTMDADDPRQASLRLLLAEYSEPKFCLLYGLSSRGGSGSGGGMAASSGAAGSVGPAGSAGAGSVQATTVLGANAFVKVRPGSVPYVTAVAGFAAGGAGGAVTAPGGLVGSAGPGVAPGAGTGGGALQPLPSRGDATGNPVAIDAGLGGPLGALGNVQGAGLASNVRPANDALGGLRAAASGSGLPHAGGLAGAAGAGGSANQNPSSSQLLGGGSGLLSVGPAASAGPSSINGSGLDGVNGRGSAAFAAGSGVSAGPGGLGDGLGPGAVSGQGGIATPSNAQASGGPSGGLAGDGTLGGTMGAAPGGSSVLTPAAAAAADVAFNIPLNAAEAIINSLIEMMTLVASSDAKLVAWKSRWMTFVVTTAFQFNPAIQPRAFIALGSLAQAEVDDGLMYQILMTLRGVLLIFSPEDDCRLLISIIRCLCYVVGNLSSESRYFKSMFWLAISLLQIGHAPVFHSALTLLQVVLKLLDERDVFAKEDPRVFLIKARSQIADVAYQLDATVGIHFRSHFSFALAANLMKGLKHPTTKTATISVLMTLLEISSKTATRAASARSGGLTGAPTTAVQRKASSRHTGGPDDPSAGSYGSPSATSHLSVASVQQAAPPSGPAQTRVTGDVVGYMIPLLPFLEKFHELFWITGVSLDSPDPGVAAADAHRSQYAGASSGSSGLEPEAAPGAEPSSTAGDSSSERRRTFGVLPPGGILGKMNLTEESGILTLSFIVTMLSHAENERELLVLYSLLAEAIVVIPQAFAVVAPPLIPILMKALSTNQTPEVVKAIEPILIGVATCSSSAADHPHLDSMSFLGEIGFPGLSSCGTFRSITKDKKITFAQCACAVVERVL